jgi:hypothetical protein
VTPLISAGALVSLVAATISLSACSSTSTAPPQTSLETGPQRGELSVMTPRRLVEALDRAGLPAPNPMDTTAFECKSTPCLQAIVTDTVRVKSFATTRQAQTYAADRGLFQVATIVVAFAPPLNPAQQRRYRAEIPELLHR